MKKNFLVLLLLCFGVKAYSQNYFYETPQGFGAATTGGGNATPIIVDTWTALRTQMSSSGAKVILVSGEITVPSGQQLRAVVTNKSLIGLPGAKLITNTLGHPGGGIIYLQPGSNNVIIRNIIFEGPGAFDVDGEDSMTADGCTNLWVDHCEFQDGLDGNFDIKGQSDNITVSWCKFTYLKPPVAGGSGGSNDHRFSNLVGSGANDAPADGRFSVTFQCNYWATGCRERMPRARNAQLHILNCYYNTSIANSRALGLGGGANSTVCYAQNTDFSDISNVFTPHNSDGGTVSLFFDNCLNPASNLGTVPAPNYTFSVMPVNEVQPRLTDSGCGAGASLQVSVSGVITPSECASLNSPNFETDLGITFYPSVVDDFLYIDFMNLTSDQASLDIYQMNGQKVLSFKNLNVNDAKLKIDLSKMKQGVYVCKLMVNGKVVNEKIIKK